MKQVVIENPIINSPFMEPQRHYRFSDDGITDEIVDFRRASSYFIPIAKPRKRGPQQKTFDPWTEDRVKENDFINDIRRLVAKWRQGPNPYKGATKTSRRLLEYWTRPDRDRKLFFCQIEALETAIYITEVAKKEGANWIENRLIDENEIANPGLSRMAFKMATGTGKTVVMAMLISWQVLNKLANPRDQRFSDAFLIVTPGITIRDRLRVLMPNDPQNYYRHHDIIPQDMHAELDKAKIVITNFHSFLERERTSAGKLTKSILSQTLYEKDLSQGPKASSPFTETPDQMVRRVCRGLGNKKNIVVLNDEAHHCYRRYNSEENIKLSGDERKEAERREEDARVWISGLEAVNQKLGVRAAYDLSATPFFLKGSGRPEGTLFPWVISDFSLIDSIECGIVKVPRVPVEDDAMVGALPTYRDIWQRIHDHLPRKGRKTEAVNGEPKLPVELEGALHSLYNNYEKYYRQWETVATSGNGEKKLTPPVFIVVCNNTNVSKLVYDYIAGWEKTLPDGSKRLVPGNMPLFSNVENERWTGRPNTILVDSQQIDSGEAMSPEFKKIAVREIEEFKSEYLMRFPGRSAEDLTDEDLLREVMNTVGKPGKLGEQVKCVVSVSMLTEGWDASTVTHILGVRAFGTQLLCEQVVGRGLRRMNFATEVRKLDIKGKTVEFESFPVEYAEVYGVPFSFIPCAGTTEQAMPKDVHRVRALEERIDCEITFPRLQGYRYDLPSERLTAKFTEDSNMAISTEMVPSWTENKPIIGESSLHTLDDLKKRRQQEVAFKLAKLISEKYFKDEEGYTKPWIFPQLLRISKQWLEECVTCKDNAFPQMLMLAELAHDAADKIYLSIVRSEEGEKMLKPILRPYDSIGSTRYVDFDTTKPVYATDPKKCHVSHVVADTESWEQKMAQVLEGMDEVVHYVKNQNLGFTIPYIIGGDERNYIPDFIVRVNDGKEDHLNLILEVSGEQRRDKATKVATTRNLWVPSVNNDGSFGRWAFLEISDPWDAQNTIKKYIQNYQNQEG